MRFGGWADRRDDMSTQTIDQQTTSIRSTRGDQTFRVATQALPQVGPLSWAMIVAAALLGTGVLTSTAVLTVLGVVVGVAAAFVLASQELGDHKVD